MTPELEEIIKVAALILLKAVLVLYAAHLSFRFGMNLALDPDYPRSKSRIIVWSVITFALLGAFL